MGKLMAGTLLALSMLAFTVPNAGAAEIPPTAKCAKTSKKLFRQYFEKLNKNDSDAATKKADRELSQALFDADCVSDVEPLLNPVPPKPFSKKCVAASKAADEFLTPARVAYVTMARRNERQSRSISRRIDRLDRRIRNLRSRGASTKRIRSIARVRRTVIKRQTRVSKANFKKLFRLLDNKTYPTLVILYELVSLRCLDPEKDFIFENEQKGPAGKVLYRNGALVFGAAIYLALKYEDFADASSASTSSLKPVPGMLSRPRDKPAIPLISE